MKHGFVIRDLISGGFWSEDYKDFKGFLYASIYKTRDDAIYQNSIPSNYKFEIVEFYKSTKNTI